MSGSPPRAAGAPKTRSTWRRLAVLTFLFVVFVSICLLHASRMESQDGARASLLTALFGSDGLDWTSSYRDSASERSAAFARVGIVLATSLYVLGVMLIAGPRPLRILSSNGLVLLVLLLGLEVSTRALGLRFPGVVRRGPSDRDLWVYDRTKGWFHAPGGQGAVPMTGPDPARVRINALGLRGGEVSRQKPIAVERVLVLGDSYVFGLGVDEENLFTTHLERLLGTRSNRTVEVVNMGVLGYSTDQELLLLEELGLKLFPNLVLLVVCDNDFDGNTEDFAYRRYYKPYFDRSDEGELVPRNIPVPLLSRPQRVKLFLGQESNLWNFVRSRRVESGSLRSFIDGFQVGVPRRSSVDPIEVTAALVLSIAERVEAAGAKFFVINTGHRGERTHLYHALRPKLRKPGIHLLGLEETLENARREAPEGLWDFGYDAHWNRDSHRLVAEVVHNYIELYGLLP